jgi:hypothetical protein
MMLKAKIRPLTVHDYREIPKGRPYYPPIKGGLAGRLQMSSLRI